jgi:hypothetical protein
LGNYVTTGLTLATGLRIYAFYFPSYYTLVICPYFATFVSFTLSFLFLMGTALIEDFISIFVWFFTKGFEVRRGAACSAPPYPLRFSSNIYA